MTPIQRIYMFVFSWYGVHCLLILWESFGFQSWVQISLAILFNEYGKKVFMYHPIFVSISSMVLLWIFPLLGLYIHHPLFSIDFTFLNLFMGSPFHTWFLSGFSWHPFFHSFSTCMNPIFFSLSLHQLFSPHFKCGIS
jgi:hypothetical protein